MLIQAILLGLVAFIAQSEYALGTSLLSRPIVTGLFTGIVLGDVKAGIIMGATLELAFIGSFSVGAAIPPDVVTGGILNQNADKYAADGNYKGVERMHLIAGFGLSLMLGLVVMISFMVGSKTVGNLLDMIPEFIQHGLSVATGLIPALGFAMLARLLINKQVAPYFFLGFALAAYLEIPVTGIAIFGAIVAVVVINIMNVRGGQNNSVQTSTGEVVDDDEDF
jgi:fructoselysine and glucoselysine-specific PTS system IIC component